MNNNKIKSTVLNGIRVFNFNNEAKYPKGKVDSISGNTIAKVNSKGYGIRLSDAAIVNVNNNTIEKSDNLGIQADKNVESVSADYIKGNVIKSSKIAIRIMTATAGEISGNKISPTKGNSIQVDTKGIAKKIINNTITTSGDTAILIRQSKSDEIKGNKITNPKEIGMYCYSGSKIGKIVSNTISGSKIYGIVINNAVVNNLDSNTISSCKSFGIYLNGSSATQVGSLKSNKISSCKLGLKVLKGPKVNIYPNTFSKNSGGNKYVINGSHQYTLGNTSSRAVTAKKSGSTIKLTWSKKGNVSGYLVYRSTKSASDFKKIGSTGASAKAFTDKKVAAKTVYYYRLLPYYKVPGSNVVIYANWTQSKGVKR